MTSAADEMRAVGAQLRALREARGLGLGWLATDAGLSKAYLSEIETGAGNPTLDALSRVAEALSVPLGQLFGVEATPVPSPAPLSAGLRQLVRERKARGKPLAPEAVAWLAAAPFRGADGPATRDDFARVHRALLLDPDG